VTTTVIPPPYPTIAVSGTYTDITVAPPPYPTINVPDTNQISSSGILDEMGNPITDENGNVLLAN
jgi:hypothetical protein